MLLKPELVDENHRKLRRLLDSHPDARVVSRGRQSKQLPKTTLTPLQEVEFYAPTDGGDPPLIVLTFA